MQKTKAEKHPGGRPTDYDPKYCKEIINLMGRGLSVAQVAKAFDVAKSTLYEWRDNNAEFKAAFKKAIDHAQAWHDDLAQKNLTARDFQAQMFDRIYRLRFERPHTKRLARIKDHNERIEAIIEAYMDRDIDAQSMKLLVDAVSVAAKVEEVTQLKARIEELEKKQSDG